MNKPVIKFYLIKCFSKLPLIIAVWLIFNLAAEKQIQTINPDLDRLVDKKIIQFQNYHFRITAHSQQRRLDMEVIAELEVVADRVHRIHFLLTDLYQAKITELRINGRRLEYSRHGDIYQVDLPFSCFKRKKLTLKLNYRLEKVISSREVIAELRGNWYPKNVLPEQVKASFVLDVPADNVGVANGQLVKVETKPKQRKIYRWSLHKSVTSLGISIGRYREVTRKIGNNFFTVYYLPVTEMKTVAQIIDWSHKILHFYAYEFGGPLPKKVTVIINNTPAGESSFGSLIYLHLGNLRGKQTFFFALAHEISHYWWGNLVFPQSIYDWWLVEGFANYSAWLANERFGNGGGRKLPDGHVYLANWRKRYQQTIINLNHYKVPEMSLAEISPFDIQRELLYTKGPFVLHMVRQMLGDSDFRFYMNQFVSMYCNRSAGVRDFTRLGVHLFGAPMLDFFRQWVYSTGQYDLAIESAAIVETDRGYTLHVKIINIGQLYLPDRVQLEIITEDRVYSEVLLFKGVNVTIQKTLPVKPLKIMLNSPNEILECSKPDNQWIF